MTPTLPNRDDLVARIQDYLGNGGLFNPEMMDGDKVRDLILAFIDYLDATKPTAMEKICRKAIDEHSDIAAQANDLREEIGELRAKLARIVAIAL